MSTRAPVWAAVKRIKRCMNGPAEGQIPSLDALTRAVRDGVEEADWALSCLVQTQSQEVHSSAPPRPAHPQHPQQTGRPTQAGQAPHAGRPAPSSRQAHSARMRFHRTDLPGVVALEAHLEDGDRGLRGSVVLVIKGPCLGDAGDARVVLCRASRAVREVMPKGYRAPLSLRLGLDSAEGALDAGDLELRVGFHFPGVALRSGTGAVLGLVRSAVVAFERLIECPEIAELLPPVVD
jgi:hypothetical protein